MDLDPRKSFAGMKALRLSADGQSSGRCGLKVFQPVVDGNILCISEASVELVCLVEFCAR